MSWDVFLSKNSQQKSVIYLCTGEGKSAKLGPNLKVQIIFCLNLNETLEQQYLLVFVETGWWSLGVDVVGGGVGGVGGGAVILVEAVSVVADVTDVSATAAIAAIVVGTADNVAGVVVITAAVVVGTADSVVVNAAACVVLTVKWWFSSIFSQTMT